MRKIFKTGHSLAVTLSKKILDNLGLKEGDSVEIVTDNNKIIIRSAGHREQLALGIKIRKSL
jgi:AbrB family looped-hinge helix DNA binding protein